VSYIVLAFLKLRVSPQKSPSWSFLGRKRKAHPFSEANFLDFGQKFASSTTLSPNILKASTSELLF